MQRLLRPCQDAPTGGADGGRGSGAVGGAGGGGAAPITPSALVIVQLSHLDRYAVVRGERAAHALAGRLIHAIRAIHTAQGVQRLPARAGKPGLPGQHGAGAPMGGPIVLADAEWPLGPASGARLRVLTVLSATPQVVWVHQDLTHERWQDAQQRLVSEVQRLRIRSAQVGGCWATRSGAPSRVSTIVAALSWAGIQTQIAQGLCAYEDDLPRLLPAAPPVAPGLAAIAATEESEEAERAAAFRRFLLLF